MGSSAAEIRAEIERQVRAAAELDAGLNAFMANEVVPYAKSQYPVESGHLAAEVKVTRKARRGKGRVGNTSPLAHLVEYGTKGDAEGGQRKVNIDGHWKTLGENTPTPELAPMAKTAKHFGGDLKRGIGGDDTGE